MKGTKRVFETPVAEDSTTTASARVITAYGVDSYDDILNSLIHVRALTAGVEGATTLNINGLGAKNIKIYKSGIKQNLPGNWVSIGQIYTIYYDGTDFILDGNYDNSGDSDTITYSMNLDTFLALSDTATAAEITEAFGGEDGLQQFKLALQYGTVTGYREIEGTTAQYTSILKSCGTEVDTTFDIVGFVAGDSTASPTRVITFSFRIAEDNTYSAIATTITDLSGGATAFEIPLEVLGLSSSSTAEDIVEAFGGEENLALFEQAVLNKTPIALAQSNSTGTEYNRIDVTTIASITDEETGVLMTVILQLVTIAIPSITILTLDKSDAAGDFNTVDMINTELATKTVVDTKVNAMSTTINTTINNIIQDLPEQIRVWALGDETTYPPVTPDEDTLTAYMTSSVQKTLSNFVTKGTILRAANILSGADRKSYYTNLYLVYKTYSASVSKDYEYTFHHIGGSNSFYIYWDDSESKWYWNQQGYIDAVVCFTGDTEILTPTGLTAIENLHTGDEVISYNFNTEQLETKQIVETASHDVTTLYTVTTEAGSIRVTRDHPFYTVNEGEVLAEDLTLDSILLNSKKEQVRIKSISVETVEPTTVYEIAVADNHNYFVGADSILVFNEACMRK